MASESETVRALCPCGAMVDWDECPYPIDRGAAEFTVCCVDPDCGWCVYGATPEGAIATWHRRTPSAEAKDAERFAFYFDNGEYDCERQEILALHMDAISGAKPTLDQWRTAIDAAIAQQPKEDGNGPTR